MPRRQNQIPGTGEARPADAECGRNALDGARENVKKIGLKTVYDRAYPPTTVDYTPIIRAVQAANPDIVYVASYPPDTAGLLRAISEIGLKTNMFGGALVGVATAAMRQQLGPLMNGIVVTELWEPAKTMEFPGIWDFLKQYQAKAPAEGVDPLGYFLPPFAYAEMQVLEQAITAVGSLDEDKLAQYMHSHPFKTIVGDLAFGPDGEWTEARPLVKMKGSAGAAMKLAIAVSVVSANSCRQVARRCGVSRPSAVGISSAASTPRPVCIEVASRPWTCDGREPTPRSA